VAPLPQGVYPQSLDLVHVNIKRLFPSLESHYRFLSIGVLQNPSRFAGLPTGSI